MRRCAAPVVGDRHRPRGGVVVGDEHGLRVADQPAVVAAVMRWLIAMLDAADAVHLGLDLDLLAEHDRRAEVELDARQDQRQALEGHVGLEDVEQVADPRLLDVAEEDRVVDVPEGIDVAEAHLQRRAVAEVIGHGAAILDGRDRCDPCLYS